MHYQEMLKL